MIIIYDIFENYTFNYLDLLSQLRLRATCKELNKLRITDLYNIPNKYREKLTQKIIIQYPNIKKLCARKNPNILDVNSFQELEVLDAGNDYYSQNCGIKQEGIEKCVKIKKLNIDQNNYINNLNHMTELILLSASGDMYAPYATEKKFNECINLEVLKISYYAHLFELKNFTKLKYLYADLCKISTDDIKNCTELVCLELGNNCKINSLNEFPNLEILILNSADISNVEFGKLEKIKMLTLNNVIFGYYFSELNLDPLINLEYFSENENYIYLYKNIEWCKRIKYLDTTYTSVNTDFANFKNLETLIINQTFSEYMDDMNNQHIANYANDISNLNITKDDLNKCPKLKTVGTCQEISKDSKINEILRGEFNKKEYYNMKYNNCLLAKEGDYNLLHQ